MADEPRRSGRATKGQHNKNASSSPAPNPKPTKTAKTKPSKKSTEPEPDQEEEEEEEERIRCICGNDNSKDKRAFIGCDACTVWQHNVCMGITDDADDIPDHYWCEECSPKDHQETLQALAQGDKIWETRNKIWQNEKKMSKSRKSRGRAGDESAPGWLKKDVVASAEDMAGDGEAEVKAEAIESKETGGSKRKREEQEEVKEEPAADMADEPEQTPKRPSRQDKRRKSVPDASTALVDIDQLPSDRQKIAQALSRLIADDVQERAKAGYRIPDGHTAKSLGNHHATRIEYALHMNHGAGQTAYGAQFRALNANLKKNKVLIQRLLDASLSADELSVMESQQMASEELQRERAEMKAELDRQAVAVQEEGPKYRRTHKGDEIIEDETRNVVEHVVDSHPVRERTSIAEADEAASPTIGPGRQQSGSPVAKEQTPLTIDTKRQASTASDRRQSSQQFDMNNIWAKTAQSPTSATPQTSSRPMQKPPRRRSSVQARAEQTDGAKVDPDIDRMLEDNDDTYSPVEYTNDDTIVWRGKLVQSSGEGEPTVNARFVAGRDIAPTVAWRDMLPEKLSIEGRLQIEKAEQYLCSLEWSQNSDVSVLALTPYDDFDAFKGFFNYFHSRKRYAVVDKHTPSMVKDLYIIPVEVGAKLPDHIQKLEHCTIKLPVEERLLLATFVVARAPGTPQVAADAATSVPTNGHHLPQHVRGGGQGPASSPLNQQTPVFSPSNANNNQMQPSAGYGAPTPFPPNPYGPPGQQPEAFAPVPPHPNPLVNEVLGSLQACPTAQQILSADPNMNAEKLENLRKILDEFPGAQTDIEVLSQRLFSS